LHNTSLRNSGNDVEGLALPTLTLANQFFALGSAAHPTGRMASLREKSAITLRDNLEVTLARLG